MKITDYDIVLSNNNDFIELVDLVFKLHPDIVSIIETGTSKGTGSTRVFAQKEIRIDTIECNPQDVDIAVQNLSRFSNVYVHWGYSLPKKNLLEFLENEDFNSFPEGIRVDSNTPVSFYKNELRFDPPEEDLLNFFITNDKKQLIFLDSAGGVGYLEYMSVMSLPEVKNIKR